MRVLDLINKLLPVCHEAEGKNFIFCKIETSQTALSRKFASERQLLFIFSSRFPTFSTNKNEWSFFWIKFHFAEHICVRKWKQFKVNVITYLKECITILLAIVLYKRKTEIFMFKIIFCIMHVWCEWRCTGVKLVIYYECSTYMYICSSNQVVHSVWARCGGEAGSFWRWLRRLKSPLAYLVNDAIKTTLIDLAAR